MFPFLFCFNKKKLYCDKYWNLNQPINVSFLLSSCRLIDNKIVSYQRHGQGVMYPRAQRCKFGTKVTAPFMPLDCIN